MADNTTMGNTTDVLRTVDLSGVKTGVSKLDVASGSELLGLAAPDVLVQASAGLTTATTAYIAGDVLGTEFTFALARAAGRGVVITSAVLYDKAQRVGAVDLYLFQTASSPAADNAPNSWADSVIPIGIIQFGAPIASALNNAGLPTAGLPLIVKSSTVNIFGVLVTRTGHTFFGAVTDLVVVLGFEPV